MNEKLYKPEFRYLTQGYRGEVSWHISFPMKDIITRRWISDYFIIVSEGAINHDWKNALIDIDAGDCYTFEDGILNPVPDSRK